MRYYSSLFSTSKPIDFHSVLNGVQQRVTEAINEELLKPFKAFKVHSTLK